jgi:hypothetical protein
VATAQPGLPCQATTKSTPRSAADSARSADQRKHRTSQGKYRPARSIRPSSGTGSGTRNAGGDGAEFVISRVPSVWS